MGIAETVKTDPGFCDRFELGDALGSGGMGTVYKGTQKALGRAVAIKLMSPDLVGTEELQQRFKAEAQVAAGLIHSNVTAVFDYGIAGGIPYLVTEMVEGQALSDVLAAGRLAPAQVLTIMRQVLDGLGAIHALGIVHRDLKPSNLMVKMGPPPHAKILDFGLAKQVQRVEGPQTMIGAIVGTPAYMAPEQVVHDPVSPATDLYALTIIFYEMIMGQRPFDSSSVMDLVQMQMHAAPPIPPTLLLPLRQVLAHGLAKRPAERFPDAQAYIQALDALGRVVDQVGSFWDTGAGAATVAPGATPVLTPAQMQQLSSGNRQPSPAGGPATAMLMSPRPGTPAPAAPPPSPATMQMRSARPPSSPQAAAGPAGGSGARAASMLSRAAAGGPGSGASASAMGAWTPAPPAYAQPPGSGLAPPAGMPPGSPPPASYAYPQPSQVPGGYGAPQGYPAAPPSGPGPAASAYPGGAAPAAPGQPSYAYPSPPPGAVPGQPYAYPQGAPAVPGSMPGAPYSYPPPPPAVSLPPPPPAGPPWGALVGICALGAVAGAGAIAYIFKPGPPRHVTPSPIVRPSESVAASPASVAPGKPSPAATPRPLPHSIPAVIELAKAGRVVAASNLLVAFLADHPEIVAVGRREVGNDRTIQDVDHALLVILSAALRAPEGALPREAAVSGQPTSRLAALMEQLAPLLQKEEYDSAKGAIQSFFRAHRGSATDSTADEDSGAGLHKPNALRWVMCLCGWAGALDTQSLLAGFTGLRGLQLSHPRRRISYWNLELLAQTSRIAGDEKSANGFLTDQAKTNWLTEDDPWGSGWSTLDAVVKRASLRTAFNWKNPARRGVRTPADLRRSMLLAEILFRVYGQVRFDANIKSAQDLEGPLAGVAQKIEAQYPSRKVPLDQPIDPQWLVETAGSMPHGSWSLLDLVRHDAGLDAPAPPTQPQPSRKPLLPRPFPRIRKRP